MEFTVDANALIGKLSARLAQAQLESAQLEAALEAEQARNLELETENLTLKAEAHNRADDRPLPKPKAAREANGHS